MCVTMAIIVLKYSNFLVYQYIICYELLFMSYNLSTTLIFMNYAPNMKV